MSENRRSQGMTHTVYIQVGIAALLHCALLRA